MVLLEMGMDERRNAKRDSTLSALTDHIGRGLNGMNMLELLGEVRQNVCPCSEA